MSNNKETLILGHLVHSHKHYNRNPQDLNRGLNHSLSQIQLCDAKDQSKTSIYAADNVIAVLTSAIRTMSEETSSNHDRQVALHSPQAWGLLSDKQMIGDLNRALTYRFNVVIHPDFLTGNGATVHRKDLLLFIYRILTYIDHRKNNQFKVWSNSRQDIIPIEYRPATPIEITSQKLESYTSKHALSELLLYNPINNQLGLIITTM